MLAFVRDIYVCVCLIYNVPSSQCGSGVCAGAAATPRIFIAASLRLYNKIQTVNIDNLSHAAASAQSSFFSGMKTCFQSEMYCRDKILQWAEKKLIERKKRERWRRRWNSIACKNVKQKLRHYTQPIDEIEIINGLYVCDVFLHHQQNLWLRL